jgi:hypothetical protein
VVPGPQTHSPTAPGAWRLRAPVAPALRRGALAAIPVAAAMLVDLEVDSPAAGAMSTGALLAGFIAFDAPAPTRCFWQLASAPAIGAAAALGALTGEPAWLAVVTITAFAAVVGLDFAVSPRLSIVGLSVVLALLLAQGLSISAADAPDALLLGAAGAALQAATTAVGIPRSRDIPDPSPDPGAARAIAAVRASLDLRSPIVHHSLRWGAALGIGTAAYHVVDLGPHGYWIPLTVVFVLRPTPGETGERIAMRAAGTLAGIAIGTPLAELLGMHAIPDAIVVGVAAAFAFALMAIEYALFTTAVTAYIVVVAHALGQSAFEAADERAVATVAGLAITAVALLLWRPAAVRRAGPGSALSAPVAATPPRAQDPRS